MPARREWTGLLLAVTDQPRALESIDGTAAALPGVRAAACFDTTFHATLPPSAATYALPAEWRERWGCGASFEGLMATRAGSVDPGLLLRLQQEGGLEVEELADGLEHGSGLAGPAAATCTRC